MRYQAIANHWNGACFSPDGEEFCDFAALYEAVEAAVDLIDIYETDADGNYTDVDLEWEIFAVDDDGNRSDEPVKTIHVESPAGKRAQEECEIVASQEDEYTTSFVGVNKDGELVKWSVNGGSRGAHDRMDGSGRWIETYDMPEEIEPLEWLRLAVEYGCDDADALTEPDAIDLGDLKSDADTDEVHWLDAAGGLWTLPVYSIDLGRGKRLAWSDTDEAGVEDVALIDSDEWPGFAESIADGLGEVVDVEQGEHYTRHAVQY